MAADLDELCARIQARGYGPDTETAQVSMLNSVLRRVAGMRRWSWLEVAATDAGDTTAGQSAFSLSGVADLLHVDAVRIRRGTDNDNLIYLPTERFRTVSHVDTGTTGVPQYWTRSRTGILLYPAPNAAYEVIVDYVLFPELMEDGTDTHPIPENYEDVLVWGAIKELCFRERDYNGRQWALDEYQTILYDMINEFNLRQRQNPSEIAHAPERLPDEYLMPWVV
jgi:hypothetical protein